MSVRHLHSKHPAQALMLAAAMLVASPLALAADGAALRVVRDAQTGQLRAPTDAEFKAMQALEARSAAVKGSPAAMLKRVGPNGAVGYRLGDAFMNYSVVTRNADGSTALNCVTGADAAARLLNAPQGTAAALNEEHGHAQE